MGRPISVTDEQVLAAARAIYARDGAEGFTISAIAREVGLSRAAITLRFKNVDALREIMLHRNAQDFETVLSGLKATSGAEGLIEIAELIGTMVKSKEGFSSFVLGYSSALDDPGRRQLEGRRGDALRAAIARVMPATSVEPDVAVDLFGRHIVGCLFSWQTSQGEDARRFLRERTINWLRLAGIAGPDESADPVEA